MRQGCISLGEAKCDGCGNTVLHSERYLLINEEDGVESESGARSCYCVACALDKGYAKYREEKGHRALTFFPIELQPEPEAEPETEQTGDAPSPAKEGE